MDGWKFPLPKRRKWRNRKRERVEIKMAVISVRQLEEKGRI